MHDIIFVITYGLAGYLQAFVGEIHPCKKIKTHTIPIIWKNPGKEKFLLISQEYGRK